MASYQGGCLCGRVRFSLDAEPVASRVCWCRDCQKLAANGTANALFPPEALHITGSTSAFTSTADSGNQLQRRFCPTCGSHLFADSSGRPGMTVVRLGTLDDPSAIKPTANIWAASAPAWACLDTTLTRSDKQPPPPGQAAAR